MNREIRVMVAKDQVIAIPILQWPIRKIYLTMVLVLMMVLVLEMLMIRHNKERKDHVVRDKPLTKKSREQVPIADARETEGRLNF